MKAIHNACDCYLRYSAVVLYPKDTEKWKQFTTKMTTLTIIAALFCIPKILKNESNSQHSIVRADGYNGCFVSQRYWKMKAIHNASTLVEFMNSVVLYPKDTEKWKQFTTGS